jgi:capsid portal protein
MNSLTNKDLLNEIIKEQKLQAVKQLQLSADFSTFMNKQESFNQKISSLLYSDSDTNSEGYIEKQNKNTERILELEIKNKVTAGKVAISVLILTAIGGIVWKAISIFD